MIKNVDYSFPPQYWDCVSDEAKDLIKVHHITILHHNLASFHLTISPHVTAPYHLIFFTENVGGKPEGANHCGGYIKTQMGAGQGGRYRVLAHLSSLNSHLLRLSSISPLHSRYSVNSTPLGPHVRDGIKDILAQARWKKAQMKVS